MAYLLAHTIRIQEDLVDQLFNSSEKRLARVLLLLAHFGKEGKPEPVIAKISQETLAEMIGTTRSRVSFFMNKFRKLGFIDYNGGVARAQLPPQCRPPRLGFPYDHRHPSSATTLLPGQDKPSPISAPFMEHSWFVVSCGCLRLLLIGDRNS